MKTRRLRDTWINRQIWPWSTRWSRAKLTEFSQENTLVMANTLFQQHTRRHNAWTSADGQYRNQIDIFAAKDGEALYSKKIKTRSWLWLRSWSPYSNFILKLKKVGKTTRQLTYDLNQIPYNYTVKVTSRFKVLDLIECLKNYGGRFVDIVK